LATCGKMNLMGVEHCIQHWLVICLFSQRVFAYSEWVDVDLQKWHAQFAKNTIHSDTTVTHVSDFIALMPYQYCLFISVQYLLVFHSNLYIYFSYINLLNGTVLSCKIIWCHWNCRMIMNGKMFQLHNVVTRGRNTEEEFHIPYFWTHQKIEEHGNVRQTYRCGQFSVVSWMMTTV